MFTKKENHFKHLKKKKSLLLLPAVFEAGERVSNVDNVLLQTSAPILQKAT